MSKEKQLGLLPPVYLLLGMGAWMLHRWLFGSFVEDPVSGLLPAGALPEILLWVLTGCVAVGAFLLPRHAKMAEGDPIIGALRDRKSVV